MDRLKLIRLLLIMWICCAGFFFHRAASGDVFSVFDWGRAAIDVSGVSVIVPLESGNMISWQYEANLNAQKQLLQNFIRAIEVLRVDAYRTARDVLVEKPEKNEGLYSYIEQFRERQVTYTDRSVSLKAVLPLFGEKGFGSLIVEAGSDLGTFPEYGEFVYSEVFTGLVIDVRGLKRVPALAPRVFDEDHRLVYSIDLIKPESFARWGVVQYTIDPYYRGYEDRVGENPLRVVALRNEKLIDTDISLSNRDAMMLLQDAGSRQHLEEGRVIIVIDSVEVRVPSMGNGP